MTLLFDKDWKRLPGLYVNEHTESKRLKLHFRLYAPWSRWIWYVAEGDADTGNCFGFVLGLDKRLGYFNIHELEVSGVKRDKSFTAVRLEELEGIEN